MNEMSQRQPHFYFSLLRLMAMLRGADAGRGEHNGVEAWVASVATYLVSYLFFSQLVPANMKPWLTVLSLIGFAFLVWLFWLLVLYFNSLLIKFLGLWGIFRTLPIRRAQSILVATWATAMAFDLARHSSWMSEVGSIWLVAVGMNLTAALILAFRDGTRRHG
jgi:hypothetical protein